MGNIFSVSSIPQAMRFSYLVAGREPQNTILKLVWKSGSITFHPFGWFLPGPGRASWHLSWTKERDCGLSSMHLERWELHCLVLPDAPSQAPCPAPHPLPLSLLVEGWGNCSFAPCGFHLSGITTLGLPHVQCLPDQFLMYIFLFQVGRLMLSLLHWLSQEPKLEFLFQ